MCWWAEKDHFGNEQMAKALRALHITAGPLLLLRTGAVATAVSTTSPCAEAEPCSFSRCLNGQTTTLWSSFSSKFIKQPELSLLCNSPSWQRTISKCLNLNLNLLILAMFASGLKFTSHYHTTVSLLSFILSLALPLLSSYDNAFFWSVWCFPELFFCVISSFISRRERTQSQTWDTINLL